MVRIKRTVGQLKPSATLSINQNVKQMRSDGKEVFHFGFGQSPFPIHKSIVNALKDSAHINHYLPTFGLEKLRVQIARFLKSHQNIDAEWEQVFVGPGSKELLYQTILILEGTFLIPKGSWVSYLPQIKASNGTYAILDTNFENNFKLTPQTLEKYCKLKSEEQYILILNSPNNPTGAIYTNQELADLADICRVHKIIVISDEIYSQINFSTDFSPSMTKYYPERTIVYGGLSKVFSAGGYRIGFMFLPKKLQQLNIVFEALFSETFSAVAAPIQFAAIKAYEMKPKIRQYIRDCSSILMGLSLYIYSELKAINIECTKPQGAFYIMIGFNNFIKQFKHIEIFTSEALSHYLLDNYNVALLPASDFYFQDEALFLRLAFVDFNGQVVKEAFNKTHTIDETFIKGYCPKIYNGIEQIKRFVLFLNTLN